MLISVTSTELARKLGDILSRVRYRRESFSVERHGAEIARVVPSPKVAPVTLAVALSAWSAAAPQDPEFAADLERVNAADEPPQDPWAS